MPAAVTYALAYIASSAGWAVGSTLLTAAGYVITIGGSIAIGNAQRRKALRRARDAYNASLQDRLVMTATVDAARSRVYGRVRTVDGVLFKATRGANSEFYTLVIAVAGHEVDAIEDVYFNDLKVTLDGSGYVQTAPYYQTTRKSASANMTVTAGTGSVVLPFTPITGSVSVTFMYPGDGGQDALPFTVSGNTVSLSGASSGYNGTATVVYQYDDGKSYARVRKYLGAPGQDLSTVLQPLFPSLVTSTDKFQGIALLLVDLEYSQDVYPTGVPNVSAVVRGAKCYDPRTTTTAWTQNPAIIARDWSLYAYGGGCTAAQIDDAMIIAAANACDVDTTFVRPSGNVTLDTYQAGIVCRLDAEPTQALDEMVEAMAGRWGWAGGVLQLVAGVYRAPVATITEDWIADASEIRIVPQPPRSELVNSYTPTISNRENDYIVEPAPRIAPSSYITADGREYPREVQMSAVTHAAHAQHVCGVMLRDGRQSLTVELPCKLHAWQLELFDTVAVTLPHFGWSAKVFEVVGWRFGLGSGVVLTLKETAASVYDPDAGFADLGNDDNTALPLPWEISPVTGLAVSSTVTPLEDGQIVTKTMISWDAHPDIEVRQSGWIEIQYLKLGTTDGPVDWVNDVPSPITWIAPDTSSRSWSGPFQASPSGSNWISVRERGDLLTTVIVGLRAGDVYLFRARAENTLRVRSRWSTQMAHKIGDVGIVETEDIAPQAATVALVTRPPGLSWYQSDFTAPTTLSSVPVGTLTWNNDTQDTVTVQMEMSANIGTQGGGGSAGAYGYIDIGYTTTSSGTQTDRWNVNVYPQELRTWVIEGSVEPGDTITFQPRVGFAYITSGPGVGGYVHVSQAVLRLTAIKR